MQATEAVRARSLPEMPRPKPARSGMGRNFFKKLLSFGAMAGVGALLVSTSLPANAFQTATLDEIAAPAAIEKQSVTVQSNVAENTVSRDSYTVAKPPPPKPVKVYMAPVVGSYSNNPNGTIQWPFPSSPVLSSYGPRGGTFHYGTDFFPGGGVPIGSIADGVVTFAGAGSDGWGEHVIVEHSINGQSVKSLYAHMRWGSISVAAGQSVSVGQFLGAVGDTGRAYGEHLHLEIWVNGAHVDPYAWLQANAN